MKVYPALFPGSDFITVLGVLIFKRKDKRFRFRFVK